MVKEGIYSMSEEKSNQKQPIEWEKKGMEVVSDDLKVQSRSGKLRTMAGKRLIRVDAPHHVVI